jgi:Family of unknown function (DUF5677)
MRILQSHLEEQIAAIPRTIVTKLVHEKLEAIGHGDNEKLLISIVNQLLVRTKKNANNLTDDFLEIDTDEEIVINFTDEDADRVQKAIESINQGLPELIQSISDEAARRMLSNYERDWADWRSAEDAKMDQFRVNLEARWSVGFDSLRMLIELSRDVGADFQRRVRRSRSNRDLHLKDALTRLHVRSIQVASETMVLMENGYADGAMARWRTLHEIACVATLISDGGELIAERYLAHEIVEARKAYLQFQRCCVQLGYKPISKTDGARIERGYKAVIERFGQDFGTDYGWASGCVGNSRPTFTQIEEIAGRAVMRSHYKMASQNVHASAKGIAYRLGSLNGKYAVIAGASNVGFVEPGQNLAITLLQMTMLLLPKSWTLDKIAKLKVLIELQRRIPKFLAGSERAIVRSENEILKKRTERMSKQIF